ncbi:hypothetical protein F5I97DRAFT_372921 [Phlebopus sp. FC_14]|nr:hypothetical protein F5I97DRAFT_372921 [Phlebopus sp. FC_14]
MANVAMFSPSVFHVRPRQLTSAARKEVLQIIRSSPQPLTTKEIRSLIRGRIGGLVVPPKGAPNLFHASTTSSRTKIDPRPLTAPEIRSRSYLKKIVLPALARNKDIEKVGIKKWLSKAEVERRLKQVPDAVRSQVAAKLAGPQYMWYWRSLPPRPSQPKKTPAPSDIDLIPKAASGIGLDLSHLSKRRQEDWKRRMDRNLQVMLARMRAKRAQSEQALGSAIVSV